MYNPLDNLLNSYNANTLYAMAVEAEIFPRTGTKANKNDVVKAMKERFFTEARVQASLAKLGPRERGVLNRLQLRGGSAPTSSLQREAVRVGVATPPPQPKGTLRRAQTSSVLYAEPGEYIGTLDKPNSTIFPDIIARLTHHGLVFSRPEGGYGYNYKLQLHPTSELFIPAEVLRYLPPATDTTDHGEDWQPPRVAASDPGPFLRDLYLYWDFVRRTPFPLLQNGMVGKRSLKAINPTLLSPDPKTDAASNETEAPRLFLLRQMLQVLKLVEARDGKLTAVGSDTAALPEFFSLDTNAQVMRCVKVWPTLDDSDTKLDSDLQRAYPMVRQARQTLLATLGGMGQGRWFDVEEMLERLQARDANFLFSQRRAMERAYRSSYYYGSSYRTTAAEMVKRFDAAEITFIRAALTGFLFDAGIVELGYVDPAAETPSFARVTEAGARILATVDAQGQPSAQTETAPAPGAAQEVHEGRVVLQPNFQILALGPVKLETLARLDLFAERRKADPNAFEYHLSRESVYRAQQAGFRVPEIEAFLRDVSGTEIPQNVQRTLDEWAAHHERIIFRSPVSLLQAADAAGLSALLDRPDIGSRLRAVGPTAALVEGDDKLVGPLLQAGIFPAVSGADPSSADHSVAVDDDGVLRPVHAVPSLYLARRLERVAQQENGGWRVTADVVCGNGRGREPVLSFVAELERLARGPLPARLVEQIRRWGAYYGDAALATLTLVELRDRRALDELREDAILRELLTPFAAGDRALAVVPTDRLAEVEARLAELGVLLKRGIA